VEAAGPDAFARGSILTAGSCAPPAGACDWAKALKSPTAAAAAQTPS